MRLRIAILVFVMELNLWVNMTADAHQLTKTLLYPLVVLYHRFRIIDG